MALFGDGPLDRELIADVVRQHMSRHYTSWAEFERSSLKRGGTRPVSYTTLKRVARGEATVSRFSFARVEAMLTLPPGTLEAVGTYNIEMLRALDCPEPIIVWVEHRLRQVQSGRQATR